jgi:FMN phosphatase YigB (HAD superfamily)
LRCATPGAGVRCVAFDLDGTLYPRAAYYADYLAFVRRALAELAGVEGAEADRLLREARIDVPGRDRGSATALLQSLGVDPATVNAWDDNASDSARHVTENRALVVAIAALSLTLPTVIVTNNNRIRTQRILDAIGFTVADVPLVITAEDGYPPKPAGDAFAAAARQLGATPAGMLAVGDRWSVDVEPVVALGGGGVEIETPDDVVAVCAVLRGRARTPPATPLCDEIVTALDRVG